MSDTRAPPRITLPARLCLREELLTEVTEVAAVNLQSRMRCRAACAPKNAAGSSPRLVAAPCVLMPPLAFPASRPILETA